LAGDRGRVDYRYWNDVNPTKFGIKLCRVPRDYYADIARQYQIQSLLDLGCGMGATYNLFRREGINLQYVGIDVTEGFIETAQELYPDAEFKIGRIEDIPYPDSSFDMVSCRCVLEHLPDPDPAIREMARTSTRVVVIVWFKWPGDSDKFRYDKRGFWNNVYSREHILEVADSVGLKLADELTVKHHLVWTLEK
jgi:SAM-dependent methyltransferase